MPESQWVGPGAGATAPARMLKRLAGRPHRPIEPLRAVAWSLEPMRVYPTTTVLARSGSAEQDQGLSATLGWPALEGNEQGCGIWQGEHGRAFVRCVRLL